MIIVLLLRLLCWFVPAFWPLLDKVTPTEENLALKRWVRFCLLQLINGVKIFIGECWRGFFFCFFLKDFEFLAVPFHALVDLQRFKSSQRLLLWEDASFMYIKYNCSSCFVYTALYIFNRGDGVVLCLMQVSVRLMQSERFTLMVSAVVNIVAGSVMSRGLEGMKQEYRSSFSLFFFSSCSCTGRCLSRKKVCGSERVTI